jgi:hypothetical protein
LNLSADRKAERSAREAEAEAAVDDELTAEPEFELERTAEPEPEPPASFVAATSAVPLAPTRHPAAGDGTPFPLAEPGEYYIGLWSGKPNYGCPYCGYATLDGSSVVELHILAKVDQGNPRHLKALELR